ncbi:MAG: nuclear transport factor 2 family protein [Bryobacter sp.]|nr:nuclear transport factor 2 family protein [Bryobacter sp.]
MTTAEIANKLVSLCSQGQFHVAMQELYSPDIVSVEAFTMDGSSREVSGIEAVMAKGQKWVEENEVHSANIEGPLVAGGHFAVTFKMDITNKAMNMRMNIEEVAVYQVKDGKIIREEFFYSMG